MARKSVFFMVMMLLSLCSSTLFAQDEYYVQSVKAKVLSGPSFKSALIAEVGRGQKLVSSGREGSWVKVKYNQRDGYVAGLLLANHPPIGKQGLITAQGPEIKQGVRRRASTYTSAAAARGLVSGDRKRLNEEGRVNYDSLEKVEAFTLGQGELEKFMEGGKI